MGWYINDFCQSLCFLVIIKEINEENEQSIRLIK